MPRFRGGKRIGIFLWLVEFQGNPSQKQRIGTTGQVGPNRLCGADLKYTKPNGPRLALSALPSVRQGLRFGKTVRQPSELEIPKTMFLSCFLFLLFKHVFPVSRSFFFRIIVSSFQGTMSACWLLVFGQVENHQTTFVETASGCQMELAKHCCNAARIAVRPIAS